MSGAAVEDAIFWTSATGDHDWTDLAVPRHVLGVAVAGGVIGDADWIEPRANAKRRKFAAPADGLADQVAQLALADLAKGKQVWLTVGGSSPHEWATHVGLSSFDRERGEVSGLNLVEMHVPREAFQGEDASGRLWAGFREAHDAGSTEWAAIHLLTRYGELAKSVYRPPLETVMRFKGIFWANFLGRRQLARFDRAVLQELEGFRVEWDGEDGLFIRASPDVAEADSPEVEQELFRLTEDFRRAKLS